MNKICRTCLSGDHPFSDIFDKNYEMEMDKRVSLCDMILSIAYIEIQSGDGLPDEICRSCVDKVNIAYHFKLLCERSDAVLREADIDVQENKYHGVLLVTSDNLLEDTTNDKETVQTQSDCDVGISIESVQVERDTNYKPMFLVGPDGVKVLSKSEVENLTCVNMEEDIGAIDQHNNINVTQTELNKSQRCTWDKRNVETSAVREKKMQEESYPCLACTETFRSKGDLRSHNKTHLPGTSLSCRECGKTFLQHHSLKRHAAIHSVSAFLCPTCGKRFHTAYSLRQHLITHQGVRPHHCTLCRKEYRTPHALREHIRCAHSDNRYNATCPVCGKKFTCKSSLVAHMKIHRGQRDFMCSVCGKSFTREVYLRTHQTKHTLVPPKRLFKCEYNQCSREFMTKASLQVHIRHKHTLERPYSCPQCFKAFASSSGLKEHRKTHTGEKREQCTLCKKKFVNKQSLKKHMRLHTGERPYPCGLCNQSFLSTSRRSEHQQSKHQERKHACDVCGKMFHLKRTLVGHMKLHAAQKETSNNTQVKIIFPKQVEGQQNVPEAGFEIVLQ